MKKVLLCLMVLTFLWSCETKKTPHPVSATVQTLPETQGPPKWIDSKVHTNLSGELEILSGAHWVPLVSKGLPTRSQGVGIPATQRPLTSFLMNSDSLWTITTPLEGYVSEDQGKSWTLKLKRETLASNAYLTSFAISTLEPDLWLAGTSFEGLYKSVDAGKTWISLFDIYTPYRYGTGYHEQINALAFSQNLPETAYVSVGKEGSKLFIYNLKTGKSEPLSFPGGSYLKIPEALAVHLEGKEEILEVRTSNAWWRYETLKKQWLKLEDRKEQESWDAGKTKRMELSKNKYGFYLTALQAGKDDLLEKHLENMSQKGQNALVVDFKNDQGELTYNSQVPLAKKIGAVVPVMDAAKVIKKVHEKGFYLIARVVVFKDKKLYNYDKNRFALWDSVSNSPWRYIVKETLADGTEVDVQKEFWVDAYSEEVWNYDAQIAKELETLGVDEVQFDYIRFPSDGPVGRIQHRFMVEGMSHLDALESFLRTARKEVSIPLSVDIYGFNGYFVTEYLGQNMKMMSNYVDAISPMFYPSHFWKTFLADFTYIDRAEIIYHDGSDRTFLATQGRVNVRPWVQAFLLGPKERAFDDKTIDTYLNKQMLGLQESKSSGYLLWNASNKYYMIKKSLAPWQTHTTVSAGE